MSDNDQNNPFITTGSEGKEYISPPVPEELKEVAAELSELVYQSSGVEPAEAISQPTYVEEIDPLDLVAIEEEDEVKSTPSVSSDEDLEEMSPEEEDAYNYAEEGLSVDAKLKSHTLVNKWKSDSDTVVQERNVFYQKGEEKGLTGVITDIQDMSVIDSMTVLTESDNLNAEDTSTKNSEEWLVTFQNSVYTQPFAGQFLDSVSRKGSQWRQSVENESGKNHIHGLRPSSGKGELVGATAISHFQTSTRVGKTIRVPLWHSGFWITIKTPSAVRQAEAFDNLRSSRVKAGMETYGRVFSNYTVFANSILLDLAYESIVISSLDTDPSNVRHYVDTSDIPAVIWALASTIWPTGFEYSRSRMGDPNNAANIIRQVIRVDNCQWTDITELTEWQRNHMAKKTPRSMSVDLLERYKNEFTRRVDRKVVIQEATDEQPEISVVLRNPKAEEYIESGQRWITDIVSTYMQVAGRPGGDKARDDYVYRNMLLTEMRAYAHWVAEIRQGSAFVTEPNSILNTLNILSESDEIRAKFFTGVFKYIDDSTISIIAITTDDEREAPLPRFPYLIPIEPVHTFFTRLEQKMAVLYNQ
ncbi:MAG: hypothetical protein M0R77_00995 [Gammaproteobacteria bacterium]|nr:hypothetical protein [Acholeplasmataceae bacterium]MCK9529132.1 hypothetical protein [Gammaproteobacteria bacterium]